MLPVNSRWFFLWWASLEAWFMVPNPVPKKKYGNSQVLNPWETLNVHSFQKRYGIRERWAGKGFRNGPFFPYGHFPFILTRQLTSVHRPSYQPWKLQILLPLRELESCEEQERVQIMIRFDSSAQHRKEISDSGDAACQWRVPGPELLLASRGHKSLLIVWILEAESISIDLNQSVKDC